jgi:hypothetical protein
MHDDGPPGAGAGRCVRCVIQQKMGKLNLALLKDVSCSSGSKGGPVVLPTTERSNISTCLNLNTG